MAAWNTRQIWNNMTNPSLFLFFSVPYTSQFKCKLEKDVVLGIWTWCRKMLSADGSIRLWKNIYVYCFSSWETVKGNKRRNVGKGKQREKESWARAPVWWLGKGGDSCSKGHGFECPHRTLDGHFFTLICCKHLQCLFDKTETHTHREGKRERERESKINRQTWTFCRGEVPFNLFRLTLTSLGNKFCT